MKPKSNWIRYVIYLLLAFLGVNLLWSFASGVMSFEFNPDDVSRAKKGTADKPNVNTSTLPKDLTAYERIADEIHDYMDGFGTDAQGVITLLSELTKDELLWVDYKFGYRPYNPAFGGNNWGPGRWFSGDATTLPLSGWIKEEFENQSASDKAAIKAIFAKLGWSFAF